MRLILAIFVLCFIRAQPSRLGKDVVSTLNEMTSYDTLNKEYENKAIIDRDTNIDMKIIIERMTSLLRNIFVKRLDVFQRTMQKVEKLLKEYVPHNLNEENIMWSRSLNSSLCDLQKRGSYKQEICLKNSSVHIPIDIFHRDENILGNVSWSAMLDDIWLGNMAEESDLFWQYFGSTSGLLRFYPGAEWIDRDEDKDGNPVDLYDVRRRSWYVQGMSLPKDMLILIDRSGSSQGQALALMKHITRSLLETLNENDQINLLTFPLDQYDVKFSPCFTDFVKATFRNKESALNCSAEMSSSGIANFSAGLEAAFLLFENITKNDSESFSGSHCNQMIMLLTDGGNEKPYEVLKRFNSFQKIRIFTYLVGPISTNAPAIKWIAEKNRGEFYQIPSIVAISSQSQEYIRYMSESKAYSEKQYTWTAAGMDRLNNELVVSLTAPLFNKSTDGEESNRTVLGVLGLDIPVRELTDTVSGKLGEYGYFFIINSQGYVLYHPRLLTMREKFLGVDIVDLETDSNMFEIRRKMINRDSGKMTVDGFDDMLDEHHVNIKTRTYNYAPIKDTTFSACIVLYDEPLESVKKMRAESISTEVFFSITNTTVVFDDKTFCPENVAEENATALEVFINSIENELSCDTEELKALIHDITITTSIGDSWVAKKESADVDNEDSILLFAETPTMIRIFPENSTELLDSFLPNLTDYKERITKTFQWIVTVYNEDFNRSNETEKVLFIGRRIAKNNLTLAVVGGIFYENWIQRLLFPDLVEPSNETESISYLLDDGAIIITTNLQRSHNFGYVGKFFGDEMIEEEIMRSMLKNNIYKKHTSTGYLASCKDLEARGTSPRLKSFMPFYEMMSPSWWASRLAWLASMMQLFTSVLVKCISGEVFFYEAKDTRYTEYCIKDFQKYMFTNDSYKPHSHKLTCGNCTKEYTTEILKDLSLLLVTVNSTDNCKCPTSLEHLPFKPKLNSDVSHQRSEFYREEIPCKPYFSENEESFSSCGLVRPVWVLPVMLSSIARLF